MTIKEAFELFGVRANSDLAIVSQKVEEISLKYTSNLNDKEYQAAKLLAALLLPFDSNDSNASKKFITQLEEALGATSSSNSDWSIQKPYIKAILQWQMTKNPDFIKNLKSILQSTNGVSSDRSQYFLEIMRELTVNAKIAVTPKEKPVVKPQIKMHKPSENIKKKPKDITKFHHSSVRGFMHTPKQIELEKTEQKKKYEAIEALKDKKSESTDKIEKEMEEKILLSYKKIDKESPEYKNYVQAVKIYKNFESIKNKELMNQEWKELEKKLIPKEKKIEKEVKQVAQAIALPPAILPEQLKKNGKLLDDKLIQKIQEEFTEPKKYKKGKGILKGSDFSIIVTKDSAGKMHHYAVAKTIGQGGFGKVRVLQDLETGKFFAGKLLLLDKEEKFNKHEYNILKELKMLNDDVFERDVKPKDRKTLFNELPELLEKQKEWTSDELAKGFRIIKGEGSSKFIEKKAKYKDEKNQYYLIGKGFVAKNVTPVLKLTGDPLSVPDEWYPFNKKEKAFTAKKLLEDYAPPERQVFMVMDYVYGEEAAEYHEKMKNDKDYPTGDFLSALVKAVKDGTNNGKIVHRDVKLQNIMYDPTTKEGKLIDYGCAAEQGKSEYSLVGSPLYQAPEILESYRKNALKEKELKEKGIQPQPSDFISLVYSEKTDVYALGISLAYSLNMLVESKDPNKIIPKVCEALDLRPEVSRPRGVINKDQALSSEVLKYLQKMTSHNSEERPSLEECNKKFMEFKLRMDPLLQPPTEKNAVSQKNKQEVSDEKIAMERPVDAAPPLTPTSVEQENKALTPEQKKLRTEEIEKQKACIKLAYTLKEFYEAKKRFHNDMPKEKKDLPKAIKEKTISASTFEEKLQRILGEKLKEPMKNPILSMQYANIMADYAGMHHDHFAGGFTLVVDPKDPSTYSIENLTRQAEKLHEQLESKEFANTCQTMMNSATASDWVALFVEEEIKSDENNNKTDEQKKLLQAIEHDIPKPFQSIMRYKTLIDAIMENTNNLKKVARQDPQLEKLEQAIAKLNTDVSNLNTNYLQPLQKNIDVVKFAKILAYRFIKKSFKKNKTLAEKEALQEAAKELRKLPFGSNYNDILNVMMSLKKKGLKIKTKKYRSLLMETIVKRTGDISRRITDNINDAKKQKSVHDQDNNKPYNEEKNSVAIIGSLHKYFQVLEEEWMIESRINKYEKNARKKYEKTQKKMAIAQSTHQLLEKIQSEKPLDLDKVVSTIDSFKEQLQKIDPKNTADGNLETVKDYVRMVKPDIVISAGKIENPNENNTKSENSEQKQPVEPPVPSPLSSEDPENFITLKQESILGIPTEKMENSNKSNIESKNNYENTENKAETDQSVAVLANIAEPIPSVTQKSPPLPPPLPPLDSKNFTTLPGYTIQKQEPPPPSEPQQEERKKIINRPPPGRSRLNVFDFAKKLANDLADDAKKIKEPSTKNAMGKSARDLRVLPTKSSYNDILNILEKLKEKPGFKIEKYHTLVTKEADQYTKSILEKLTREINSETKAKNDDESQKIIDSLLQYMQAFEIQLRIAGKDNNNKEITATRFYYELLEKYKEEKPLSLAKVASVVTGFSKQLPKEMGDSLDKNITDYIKTVSPDTVVQPLDIPKPTLSFVEDNITIVNQILGLQTPGDRRLGQLIALQPGRLSEDQKKVLNSYIGWRNNPTKQLATAEQDYILATIKEIRKESSIVINQVVLKQIIEIKNAIDNAANNPFLREKLKNALDQFEETLSLIIPPHQHKANLEQAKKFIFEARTSIQQADAHNSSPAADNIPQLTEMDRRVLAKIELRQALLEKREANTAIIEIKNSAENTQDIDYEKLRSSYNSILPSITKTIDREFTLLIKKQIEYLGELNEGYPKDREIQDKLQSTWLAIIEEANKRKNSSPETELKEINKILSSSPFSAKETASIPVPLKKDATQKKEQREKEIALAMLELRQGLIEQRMVSHAVRIEDAEIDKDNLLSNTTKNSYKELNKKYGEARRENFDLAEYSKKVGIYKIGKKEDMSDLGISVEEQKKLVLKIVGEKGYKILHPSDAIEAAVAPKSARKLYLQYLQSALDKHTKQDKSDKVITMEELLGKTGKNLYRAAMQEEANDPAFINAVFLSAVENFRGPKWAKKLVLWIAGPSSSGKSYATKGMIKRIAQWVMPKEIGEISDNYVVTIDGAIQREVSQMRKLTVDVAIELGYRGVKGVDKGTKGELKKRILNAAETKDDLSIAIPDTLTKYALQSKNKIFTKLFKSHAKDKNTLHVYSQIKSGESIEAQDTFALSVGRMGESRAYIKIGKNHYSITIDGKVIIESKKYDKGKFGENFALGISMAKIGKKIYRKIQKKCKQQAYDFDVIHDLMFITLDRNKWRECSSDDKGDMRMITRRAFNAWLEYQKEHPANPEEDQYQRLDTWLADKKGGNKPTLTEPIINFYYNGIKKDYATDKLLSELEDLKKEAEKADKSLSELQDLQKEVGKIALKDTDSYKKISSFIRKITLSKSQDPINVWKDHETNINAAKQELSISLELALANKMRIIEDWLKPENKPLVPVDLIKIGDYIAYHASSKIPANLDAARKKQLQNSINELRNVPQAGQDQDLYIRACINKIADLNVLDTKKLNQIHLAYAAAKVRDAYNKTLDKKEVTTVINSSDIEKNTASYLRSYLEALKNKWELEDLVTSGYKQEKDREYNNQRLAILKNALAELKTDSTFTLQSIKKFAEKLKADLTAISTASSPNETLKEGTEEAVKSLTMITNKFIEPVAAVINTQESFTKAIDKMKDTLVKTLDTSSFTREIVTNMESYLKAIQLEWTLSEQIGDVSKAQIKYNQSRLKILEDTITKLSTAKITLQQAHAELHNLQTNLQTVPLATDQEWSDKTKQVCAQLKEMQIACVGPALYKTWLTSTVSELDQSPIEKNSMNFLHLGQYIASLIDHEYKTSANPDKEGSNVIKTLQEIKESPEKDNLQQKFIYDTLSKLKDHDRFTLLLIKHAQAIRRDIQANIEAIMKQSGVKIDKPDSHDKYVADKMIEYLKSIEAEWVARELTTGTPKESYTEQRKILNQSIATLEEKSNPTLDFINDNLKTLGTKLQGTLSKPTGLARVFIFASRSKVGEKSAKQISHIQDDISSIKNISDNYITSFIAVSNKAKKIQEAETRRIFLTGKDSKDAPVKDKSGAEIQGTASILKSFGDEVKQQRRQTEYKAGDTQPTAIDLPGWKAQRSAKITDSTTGKAPNLAAKTKECRGLPSGMCIEYKLQDDNTTTIRESHQNNHVNISAPIEPLDYVNMEKKDKLAIDITIAEAMIRLWVARCGTPVYISDTANESRMRALIIVCEAHDLHYELPYSSRFNYSFLNNPKVALEDNIKALEKDIGDGNRAQIKVLNYSDAMQELERKFHALKTHYEELKSSTTLPEEEKKRYAKEINTIDELIDNAKKGKYNTKAANDAVMELNKSLAEIEKHPVSRSFLRGGG